MLAYITRRILLMIPTIFGIMLVSFVIVQFAPGGPVERAVAQAQGLNRGGGEAGAAGASLGSAANADALYRGSQGLDPKFIEEIKKQYGFDKPAYVRFWMLVRDFSVFDFGKSFKRDVPVLELIKEKLPVSISLGLWMTILSYLISIPLGIRKAVKDGTRFDSWTSAIVIIGYAVPSFLFGEFLLIVFAGGSFYHIFPFRGLHSGEFEQTGLLACVANYRCVGDYIWHLTLPIAAMVLGAFATTTFLTKNSFLDEIKRQYVQTARMKGLSERRVLYGHVFRNAMLLVISGFPAAFIGAFFTGALLIEKLFNLDGLGLLSYESVIDRDYPVVFANLYIFSLLGLVINLITDLTYMWIDPRIDFATRDV